MKIAAVNFNAVFADVEENLRKAAEYTKQAAAEGAELILFPEFFTSSMGFSVKMLDVPVKSKPIESILKKLAAQQKIIIGGSYLYYDGNESYNLFQLVFPDGSVFSHRKDIPTIAENCYYVGGDEENVLKTPIGDIGVALCWEMERYDTLKRLSQKVDIVLAGTCWADLRDGAPLKEYNRQFALKTPVTFAKLLHVPVIHSNHCGTITAFDYPDEKNPYTFQMVGATQMVDRDGNIIARKAFDDGEGLIISDISTDKGKRKPADIDYGSYWIEPLPEPYLYAWENYNRTGKNYYETVSKPYYQANYKIGI